MKQTWWKLLAVLTLLYVFVTALFVPLNPSILSVDSETFVVGSNTCSVKGYNTHFLEASESLQAFIVVDSIKICGTLDEVAAEDEASFSFLIEKRPSETVIGDFYVNNNIDGSVYMPRAIVFDARSVIQGSIDDCNLKVETNEHSVFGFPFQPILYETIRNLMFHVPMWFTMFFLMIISVVQGTRYLASENLRHDRRSEIAVRVGLVFCILGLITGSIWARFTWGAWWLNDPQLNGAMTCFLIYAAYLSLRRSITDDQKRARISAIYNIFAFVMLVVLLMILPKFTESLHPGKEGTPAFSSYDLDSSLRIVFYPAVIGWILLGYWIYTLRLRLKTIETRLTYGE